MDFRILGPVEVVENGTPLPLGGPRQRALLALLLRVGVDEPLQTKPYGLGTACEHSSVDEPIDGSRQVVVHASHQLSHASSIGNRNALRNASRR